MENLKNLKVFVYYNLHKHCWSIKALEGARKGRVVAHASRVLLDSAEFKVSEAGRQRVLRERKKNVHAGVIGKLLKWEKVLVPLWVNNPGAFTGIKEVAYNPYKFSTFVDRTFFEPVYKASTVFMMGRKVWVSPY
jgi:hypothetical protein